MTRGLREIKILLSSAVGDSGAYRSGTPTAEDVILQVNESCSDEERANIADAIRPPPKPQDNPRTAAVDSRKRSRRQKTEEAPEEALMDLVGRVFVIACLVVLSILWRAIAAKLLWQWFAVEQLGLPAISMVQCAGILILFSVKSRHSHGKDRRSFSRKLQSMALRSVISPSLLLFIGYIAHLFL